ncbi:MAG: HAD hydrolase family protein [Verrucomicrobia bacterium]|nr:HAD hydrolase family protein [Verrucomicrobiota bacterium]
MSDSTHPVRLFATDLDDTILGDAMAAERFRFTWQSLDAERRPLLVYNTGRNVGDTQWLVLERQLPAPEFIIGGIGTEMHDAVDAHVAAEFHASIAPGWDGATVERIVESIPGVHRQPAEFLNPCKLSWHWHRATAAEVVRLEIQFEKAGLDVTVGYANSVYLDVVPRRAGKGNALAWLCRRIGVPLENVLVAGASANNGSMFALAGVRGILVGNASGELFAAAGRFKPLITREKMADGVLAGLSHFGVLEAAGHLYIPGSDGVADSLLRDGNPACSA